MVKNDIIIMGSTNSQGNLPNDKNMIIELCMNDASLEEYARLTNLPLR